MSIQVRRMQESDAKQVAALHLLSYPEDHFTQRLSMPILEKLCRRMCTANDFCYVALDGAYMAGVAIAGRRAGDVAKRFAREHVWSMFCTLLQNPEFIPGMARRLLSAVPGFRKIDFVSSVDMRYLNLLVHPSLMGKGVGQLLTDQLEGDLRAAGYDRYGHSVRQTNPRTIAFHKKNGCMVEHETAETVYFIKYLSPSEENTADPKKSSTGVFGRS